MAIGPYFNKFFDITHGPSLRDNGPIYASLLPTLLPNHVYLFNKSRDRIVIRLNHPRNVAPGTMRKGATVPWEIWLDPGRMTDVTVTLDVAHNRALEILRTSPEVSRWSPQIDIIDANDRPAPESYPVPIANIEPAPPVQPPSLAPPPETLQVIARARAIAQAQQEAMMDGKDPESVNVAQVVATVPALPMAKYESRADNMDNALNVDGVSIPAEPSITWKREKLVEHAKLLGIDAGPNMGKSAILRAIRDKMR